MHRFYTRPVICCLFLFFLFSKTFSQNLPVWYFDNDFNRCSKDTAVYYGSGIKKGDKTIFTFYNAASRSVKIKGEFTDSTLSIKNGYFIYYDETGNEELRGSYINNAENGYWETFSNGFITDSTLFENGEDVVLIKFNYHPLGKLASRLLIESRKKLRQFTGWDQLGRLLSTATWVDGDGERKTYRTSGKLEKIETYKKNKIESTRYFKEDGTEITNEEQTVKNKPVTVTPTAPSGSPAYPGGWAGFNSFFSRNFKTPASFGREGFSELVTVTFYLDKSGFARDIKVSGTTNRDVEIEVMTVFRRMAAWNMNGHTSFGPITYSLNLSPN